MHQADTRQPASGRNGHATHAGGGGQTGFPVRPDAVRQASSDTQTRAGMQAQMPPQATASPQKDRRGKRRQTRPDAASHDAARRKASGMPGSGGAADTGSTGQRSDPRPWMGNQTQAKATRIPFRKSMARKISSSYMRMFTNWLYGIFATILVANLALDGYLYFNQLQAVRQEIEKYPAAELATVATLPEPSYDPLTNAYVVVDMDGTVLLDATRGNNEVTALLRGGAISSGPLMLRFVTDEQRLWLSMPYGATSSDGMQLSLRYAADVTLSAFQLVVVFGGSMLLITLALVVIGLQGRFMTRRTFRMIDELTAKISAISSQNLNLRLNVSDSTDELVEMAVTFNSMMERLERAYGKQSQFVSDASHELRTPISVIQGYARMLERWGKSDPAILDEAIGAISKESRNMQDLVEKLLFIARNDRDSLVLVMEPFSLSDMVEELGRETGMLETGHAIVCDVQPGICIKGDRNRIKQAMRVFVDNALKYTDKSGSIMLRLAERNGMAEATVQDTGIGIPEKDLQNVFDRFYRVDSARERNTGGHGLGLSIARIIVLRHGGKITVGSKPGVGTRFTIKLPPDATAPSTGTFQAVAAMVGADRPVSEKAAERPAAVKAASTGPSADVAPVGEIVTAASDVMEAAGEKAAAPAGDAEVAGETATGAFDEAEVARETAMGAFDEAAVARETVTQDEDIASPEGADA